MSVYVEAKKCRICGATFSVTGMFGNPYKWCPCCRHDRWDKACRMAEKVRRKNK